MEEFRRCPECGYERGFHVCFRKEERGVVIGLICPDCGQSYNINWRETDIAGLAPAKGQVYRNRS